MFTRPGNCRGAVRRHVRLQREPSLTGPVDFSRPSLVSRCSMIYLLLVGGDWNILHFSHIYIYHISGISSSQLTFIFFRRVETTYMNFMIFHSVGNFIIPTDVHSYIFQRGWLKPPTRLRKHDFPIAIGYPLVNSHITMENHING